MNWSDRPVWIPYGRHCRHQYRDRLIMEERLCQCALCFSVIHTWPTALLRVRVRVTCLCRFYSLRYDITWNRSAGYIVLIPDLGLNQLKEHVELELTIKNIRGKQNYYGTIQKYQYQLSPNFGSKNIGNAIIDTAFENYRRYYDRYRKSIGDTANTDTLSRH
jgi:hypothetical protein